MMWNKLIQSLSPRKASGVKKAPAAKTAGSAGAGASASRTPAQSPSTQAGDVKSSSASISASSKSAPLDPKEAALQAERDAVRASFQSDPHTVVAVIRAWLHEDSKQASAPKEDAKSR